MYKIFNFLFLVLSLSVFNTLKAADLLDIYNRALENNNNLKIIESDYFISKEQYNQTLSTIFPDINIVGQTKDNTIERYEGAGSIKNYDHDTYSVNLTQPILRLNFFDELDKASININKSNFIYNDSKKDLMLEVTEIYFNLINQINLVKISKTKKYMLELKLSNARLLYNDGMITDIELYEHENNANIASIELEKNENKLISIKQEVYILTGKNIFDVNTFNPDAQLPSLEYDFEMIMSQAMTVDSNIVTAIKDVKIAENDLSSNRSDHYPTVDLVATYDYSDTSIGSYRGAAKQETSSLSLVLNIPVFQGGYISSKVRESRYGLEKTKYNLDLIRKNTQKKVLDTFNAFILNKNLFKIKKDNLKNAKKSYSTIKKGFKLGVNTDIEVTNSKYLLDLAEKEYIESVGKYLISDLKIKKHTSKLNIKDLENINKWLIW